MEPKQRAELEEQIAAVDESTERRTHETAKRLPDPKPAHSRADKLTEKAQAHLRHARHLRHRGDDRNDS